MKVKQVESCGSQFTSRQVAVLVCTALAHTGQDVWLSQNKERQQDLLIRAFSDPNWDILESVMTKHAFTVIERAEMRECLRKVQRFVDGKYNHPVSGGIIDGLK